MKFLVWGVVIALVLLWIFRPRSPKTPRSGGRPAAGAPEAMLQCAECGMHFPASEALAGPDSRVFCSEEHRQRHAAR